MVIPAVILFTRSLRRLQVTNKSDMSDFYRNLLKSNVAFGARNVPKLSEKDAERSAPESHDEDEELRPSTSSGLDVEEGAAQKRLEEPQTTKETTRRTRSSSATRDRHDSRSPPPNRSRSRDGADTTTDMDDQKPNAKEKSAVDAAESSPARRETESPKDPKGTEPEVPKRPAADPVAAAKERYLARKKQRGL